ncbi:unnamed protein product [Angiostrongylus costaricensis]|uniref:Reverse transcriptase domain-containing protein n=1 Tax=Angiostrongylus costaricensis TaxID=334426 RepID=A0A0R3PQB9_ANGCS|nr:unnamed protein product [Angiostrongylus costaricensis]
MGVKIDGRRLHHLRFAYDIILIKPNISQEERMLANFDKACGKIGVRLYLTTTMFMRNRLVSYAPFTLNGTNISECYSYAYLGRKINMLNDLDPELSRRQQAAWGAFKSVEEVVKRTKNTRLRAHLFDLTALSALTYASKSWSLRKQDEKLLRVIECAVERTMLGVSRFTQLGEGIRSSVLRQRSKIKNAVLYVKQSKIRWFGHAMRMNNNRWTRTASDWISQDIKRTARRPPTGWSEFFT